MYSNNKSRYSVKQIDDRTLVRPFATRKTVSKNKNISMIDIIEDDNYLSYPGDEIID